MKQIEKLAQEFSETSDFMREGNKEMLARFAFRSGFRKAREMARYRAILLVRRDLPPNSAEVLQAYINLALGKLGEEEVQEPGLEEVEDFMDAVQENPSLPPDPATCPHRFARASVAVPAPGEKPKATVHCTRCGALLDIPVEVKYEHRD
jgi:hypothetical protein